MSVLSAPYMHDEAAAFAHVEAMLWADGPVCPHCGVVDSAYRLTGVRTKSSKKNPEGKERHGLWKCRECRKQFTVRKGTIFEESHLPLHLWLQAIHLMVSSKKGISSHQLHRVLGITYKSAWFLTHRIRECMRDGALAPMGGDAVYEIQPQQAERSLAAINGEDDAEYDYLFSTFSRKEFGSIEGRIIDLSTDYDEPSIKLREHRSGREIQCRISDDARDEIENSLTAGDVWTHRRARVRGIINYDPNGKIVRVYDGRIAFIETKDRKTSDIRDPDFTGGLPAYEYIDKLRENELG